MSNAYRANYLLLLITAIVGVMAFGGHIVAYAAIWKGIFAAFLVLTVGGFVTGYRQRCCR